jgi:hypothetical protein
MPGRIATSQGVFNRARRPGCVVSLCENRESSPFFSSGRAVPMPEYISPRAVSFQRRPPGFIFFDA